MALPLFDATAGARQILGQLRETVYGQSGAFAQLRPFADPSGAARATALGLQAAAPQLVIGHVVDLTAVGHCYKVQCRGYGGTILATTTSQTSFSSYSAREIKLLTPGTTVLLALDRWLGAGFILAVLPPELDDLQRCLADQIAQTSRVLVDEAHKRPLRMVDLLHNWQADRPLDGCSGDWGMITPHGLRITLDNFLLQVAVNEFCGLFGFYHDSLLRIAGYNHQFWTAGHERDAYDDQGEYNDLQFYTPYPWEARGMFDPRQDPGVKLSPEITQQTQPWYGPYEPRSDRQQPFLRVQHFQGYLGQGGRQVLVIPPRQLPSCWQYQPGPTEQPTSAYTTDNYGNQRKPPDPPYQQQPPIAVHADTLGLDGRRTIATAKGLHLSKRPFIPHGMRRKRPEDGAGDKADNYRPAGQLGDGGPEHKITGDVQATSSHPGLQRAAGLLDLHAYLFSYSGVHPFVYHAKDYETPEEDAYPELRPHVPQFGQLAGQQTLEPPAPVKLKVDERYGEQDYYPTAADLDITDDGNIVLGNGYGAEIRLVGGDIVLSCPGDIYLKSGRNLLQWAGRDISLRAKGTLEGSATDKAVRFKSETDLLLVSGNSGHGGLLLENRADGPAYNFAAVGDDIQFGGVVVKSKSDTVLLGKDMYLRTYGGSGGVTIDCNKGAGLLITHAQDNVHFVSQAVAFCYGSGSPTQVAAFTAQSNLLPGVTYIGSGLLVDGPAEVRNDIVVADGHIATSEAERFGMMVPPLDAAAASRIVAALDAARQRANNELPMDMAGVYSANPEQQWRSNQRPGEDETLNKLEFSFRTPQQARSTDFVCYEDRWQQLAREGKQQLSRWEEKGITSSVETTMPFPGRARFESDALQIQALTLCTIDAGRLQSKPRGTADNLAAAYQEPQFAAIVPKPLNDYTVVG